MPVLGDKTVLSSDLELVCGIDYSHADKCPLVDVPVTVTNAGSTASDFVVLLFAAGEYGPPPYPLKTLVGYKRLRDVVFIDAIPVSAAGKVLKRELAAREREAVARG